jgi:hypothetical protein
MKRPREVLATAPGRGTRVRWTHTPRRALRHFQSIVRGLINAIRLPGYRQNLPYTRDFLHYVYRLKTPLSRITQTPRNPSRYAHGLVEGVWDSYPHAESSASVTNSMVGNFGL